MALPEQARHKGRVLGWHGLLSHAVHVWDASVGRAYYCTHMRKRNRVSHTSTLAHRVAAALLAQDAATCAAAAAILAATSGFS